MTTKSYNDVGAVERITTPTQPNQGATDVGAVQAQAQAPTITLDEDAIIHQTVTVW